jgi:peptidoglycan/LPS O-acetylase OafA/YrhL
LKLSSAAFFIVFASGALILIFYFLAEMAVLVTVLLSIASTFALSLFLFSLVEKPAREHFPQAVE